MARLFISYPQLDQMVAAGQVALAGMRLTWTDGVPYNMQPAVLFMTVVGADSDPNDLLGRVKTVPQLAEVQAEHYNDSVLIGEVGYQVLEGFVGERA